MILINIGLFLLIAEIFIAVYKPTSKSDKWIFSLVIPLVLFFLELVIGRFYYGKEVSFTYLFASTIGESLVSVILSFVILFIYLKKKYTKEEQFIFPKWLIATTVILFALGLFSQWGNYRKNKALAEKEPEEMTSQPTETAKELLDNKELSNEAEDARKVLPELVALINQGLPVTREGMTMNSMEIKDNAVVVSYVIDETKMNFDEVTNGIINEGLEFFQLANANNKQMINNIITAEYDYSVEFKASKSGKVKWLTLLANELKDAYIK